MAQGNPISVIGVEDLFTGQYQDSPTGTGLESNMHPAPLFLLSLLSFLRTGTAILLFPLLIACGSPGGLDSWLDTGPNDADGDGVFDQDDCDDTNADIFPGAVDRCDGVDQDCDDAVDEDQAFSVWPDNDGDTWGAISGEIWVCQTPEGHAGRAGDCDDTDPAIHPEASEACDSLDNDCDESLDEGYEPTPWYTDADGDGQGNEDDSVLACDPVKGRVSEGGDCDDEDANTYTSAPEICDGLDNDCNGTVDDDVTLFFEFQDRDEDGFGDPDLGVCVTGPDTGDTGFPPGVDNSDDCDDRDPDVYPDAPETCDGHDENCDGLADDAATCPCPVQWDDDSAYMICTNNKDWNEAEQLCQSVSYNLITVGDSTESDWLRTTAASIDNGTWWVGFNDQTYEGNWRWASGDTVTFTNWASGEPNGGEGENCAEMYTTGAKAGRWNDANCDGGKPFVCESR